MYNQTAPTTTLLVPTKQTDAPTTVITMSSTGTTQSTTPIETTTAAYWMEWGAWNCTYQTSGLCFKGSGLSLLSLIYLVREIPSLDSYMKCHCFFYHNLFIVLLVFLTVRYRTCSTSSDSSTHCTGSNYEINTDCNTSDCPGLFNISVMILFWPTRCVTSILIRRRLIAAYTVVDI